MEKMIESAVVKPLFARFRRVHHALLIEEGTF